jgi:hypothetical protein
MSATLDLQSVLGKGTTVTLKVDLANRTPSLKGR